MSACECCGCVVTDDYGTSIVTGEGTRLSPYYVELADPGWSRPVVRIRRNTSQSIPNNTLTPVTFSTEIFDIGGYWVIGSPTILTMPETGLYVFGGSGRWAANGTGTREMGFRRNGTQVLHINDNPSAPTIGAANALYHNVTYQYPLDAGDTLELVVRQESGGALNLFADGSSQESIVFWAAYMGRTII